MVDIFSFINLIERLQKVCMEKDYNLEIGFPPKKDCFFLEVGKKEEYYTILEGVYIEGDTYLVYQNSCDIIKTQIESCTRLKEITEFPSERKEE